MFLATLVGFYGLVTQVLISLVFYISCFFVPYYTFHIFSRHEDDMT